MDGGVGHVEADRLHYVAAAAGAALAELRANAALHVAACQRQERNEARDELLLDDAGLEEATCREKPTSVSEPEPDYSRLSGTSLHLACKRWNN